MRVFSFALALFAAEMVAEAGVCKPSRTTASQSALTSSVESSTAAASTTLIETSEVSTGYSASVTETASSDSSIETIASSTALAETTSTAIASTVTTDEAATTTTQDAGPSFSPGSLIGTGPVADLTLQGSGSRFVPLSFATSDSAQTLIFSLVSGKLSTGINNNNLCLTYKDKGVLGPLVLCPFDNFNSVPLDCQQLNGQLSCSVPNGSCDKFGSCNRPPIAIPFSQFYVNNAGEGFFGLAGGSYDGVTAIDPILAE
ncbi:hypothetical protein FGRMN_10331 [Fusarium graminum]|nr:hypothetical protein FGRMN_10331 [Fusarium graminum]